MSKDDKKRYEVWGYDTFAHEHYFCRGFNRKPDAEAYMELKRQDARKRSSDDSLVDSFYLIENFSLHSHTPRIISEA